MCLRTMCSKIFPAVQVKEMGRKFEGSELLPDLGTGATFAIFQSLGSMPKSSDLLYTKNKYFDTHSAYLNRKAFGIFSGPPDFLGLRLSSKENIPDSVKLISAI